MSLMPPTSAVKALFFFFFFFFFFFYAIEHTARAQQIYQDSNSIIESKSPKNFNIFIIRNTSWRAGSKKPDLCALGGILMAWQVGLMMFSK